VRPLTTHEVSPVAIVHVSPFGDAVTRYEVGNPPLPRFAVTRTLSAKADTDGARGVVMFGLHAAWV
jgi:hypothetical protein